VRGSGTGSAASGGGWVDDPDRLRTVEPDLPPGKRGGLGRSGQPVVHHASPSMYVYLIPPL